MGANMTRKGYGVGTAGLVGLGLGGVGAGAAMYVAVKAGLFIDVVGVCQEVCIRVAHPVETVGRVFGQVVGGSRGFARGSFVAVRGALKAVVDEVATGQAGVGGRLFGKLVSTLVAVSVEGLQVVGRGFVGAANDGAAWFQMAATLTMVWAAVAVGSGKRLVVSRRGRPWLKTWVCVALAVTVLDNATLGVAACRSFFRLVDGAVLSGL